MCVSRVLIGTYMYLPADPFGRLVSLSVRAQIIRNYAVCFFTKMTKCSLTLKYPKPFPYNSYMYYCVSVTSLKKHLCLF